MTLAIGGFLIPEKGGKSANTLLDGKSCLTNTRALENLFVDLLGSATSSSPVTTMPSAFTTGSSGGAEDVGLAWALVSCFWSSSMSALICLSRAVIQVPALALLCSVLSRTVLLLRLRLASVCSFCASASCFKALSVGDVMPNFLSQVSFEASGWFQSLAVLASMLL